MRVYPKIKRYLSLLICISLFIPLLFVNAIDTPVIKTWGQSTILDDADYYAFQDIIRLDNGDLLLAYFNSDGGHASTGEVECIISDDDGVTWGAVIDIYGHDNGRKTADAGLAVTSNGTVICCYRDGDEADDPPRGSYSVSYDNGLTWRYMGLIGNSSFCMTGSENIGEEVYGCMHGGITGSGNESFQYYNTVTQKWELVGWLDEGDQVYLLNEWDFLPITDTYFIGVSRTKDTTTTYFMESFDSGMSWTNYVNIYAQVGRLGDPNLDWLNEDQDILILHGRKWVGTIQYSCFYISSDFGLTWTNYTSLDASGDGAYTGFASYGSQDKGYLTWFDGGNIYGIWIGDNTTYGSPGTYDPPIINHMGYLLHGGSGQLGNTSVIAGSFWINWTWDTSGTPSSHMVVIANDTSFTNIVYNYNVSHSNPYLQGDYMNITISNLTSSSFKKYVHIRSFYEN